MPATLADGAAIADRTLDATEVIWAGEDLLPPGAYIQLMFSKHGRFDVNASGCHYMNGRYAVERGRLLGAEVEARLIGCGEVRDDRDWWFARLLASEPQIGIDGTEVLLASEDVRVRLADHFEVATWELDPAFELGPERRTLHLLVLEGACASGQSPEGRILEPVVEYRPDHIAVEIRIRTLAEAVCPGNAPYPFTVELSEPVGNRRLSGGGSPIVPPVTPTPGG